MAAKKCSVSVVDYNYSTNPPKESKEGSLTMWKESLSAEKIYIFRGNALSVAEHYYAGCPEDSPC